MTFLSDSRIFSFVEKILKKLFFVKEGLKASSKDTADYSTAVIIPTYKPNLYTYKLITSIKKWNSRSLIIIVDDCTPLTGKYLKFINNIRNIARYNREIVYLRTPRNILKAGALNHGIEYLKNLSCPPRVVFTMDDDIRISRQTLNILKGVLYSQKKVGAVCSQVQVLNKDKNILTRLQALEYQSFNITKIADNHFLKGPLVMQGMLTAFRMTALRQVKGFTPNHLIEDYDITARLKSKGWRVKIATKAVAGTRVPENFSDLWKQRVRWTYWGLWVVGRFWKNITITFQDTFGHVLFLGLLLLIFISLFIGGKSSYPSVFLPILIILVIGQFALATIYNLIVLSTYPNRNKFDWVIKLTILPEFIYCNLLSLVLVGSYLFFLYGTAIKAVTNKINLLSPLYKGGLLLFGRCGYSLSWGTRQNFEKGGPI